MEMASDTPRAKPGYDFVNRSKRQFRRPLKGTGAESEPESLKLCETHNIVNRTRRRCPATHSHLL